MYSKQLIAEIVNKYAIKYELRPEVVMCIVIQESKGDTFAWRWEEAFYERNLKGKDRSQLTGWLPKPGTLPTLPDELLQRSCSYGPMQVLGETARWCAKVTTPFLTALCDPDFGIETGCKILSFYLNRAKGDYRAGLKGYNGAWTYADEVLHRVKNNEHMQWFRSE